VVGGGFSTLQQQPSDHTCPRCVCKRLPGGPAGKLLTPRPSVTLNLHVASSLDVTKHHPSLELKRRDTMARRHQTLPPAQTSSAREALQSFYCQLCSKGYSRMNDYEAHLSSYDHSHKQRLKDMKAMVRDPNAGARARRAEAKADGLVSIKLGEPGSSNSSGGGGGGGFKKGGFKKSGFKTAFNPAAPSPNPPSTAAPQSSSRVEGSTAAETPRNEKRSDSESEDEAYERYDPRHPTD
jgi:uncharacterized protein (UPF0297 family)